MELRWLAKSKLVSNLVSVCYGGEPVGEALLPEGRYPILRLGERSSYQHTLRPQVSGYLRDSRCSPTVPNDDRLQGSRRQPSPACQLKEYVYHPSSSSSEITLVTSRRRPCLRRETGTFAHLQLLFLRGDRFCGWRQYRTRSSPSLGKSDRASRALVSVRGWWSRPWTRRPQV